MTPTTATLQQEHERLCALMASGDARAIDIIQYEKVRKALKKSQKKKREGGV